MSPANPIPPAQSLETTGFTTDAAALYLRYARPLFAFILHRVGDPGVAEELVQDVFERMLIGLPQYEDRGYPVGAWLYKIAACRAVDWIRKHSRRHLNSLDYLSELADEAWPDGEDCRADREARQRVLLAALEQLTERQAAVIRLRFFAELPIAEVANRLGLTPQAVKALQHRGVAQLRLLLTPHGAYHAGEAA